MANSGRRGDFLELKEKREEGDEWNEEKEVKNKKRIRGERRKEGEQNEKYMSITQFGNF